MQATDHQYRVLAAVLRVAGALARDAKTTIAADEARPRRPQVTRTVDDERLVRVTVPAGAEDVDCCAGDKR